MLKKSEYNNIFEKLKIKKRMGELISVENGVFDT